METIWNGYAEVIRLLDMDYSFMVTFTIQHKQEKNKNKKQQQTYSHWNYAEIIPERQKFLCSLSIDSFKLNSGNNRFQMKIFIYSYLSLEINKCL